MFSYFLILIFLKSVYFFQKYVKYVVSGLNSLIVFISVATHFLLLTSVLVLECNLIKMIVQYGSGGSRIVKRASLVRGEGGKSKFKFR